MAKFSVFENQTHLGTIQAGSQQDALKQVRNLYPGRSGLRVEPEERSDMGHANPVSIEETKKAFDKILGRDGMYRRVYEDKRRTEL